MSPPLPPALLVPNSSGLLLTPCRNRPLTTLLLLSIQFDLIPHTRDLPGIDLRIESSKLVVLADIVLDVGGRTPEPPEVESNSVRVDGAEVSRENPDSVRYEFPLDECVADRVQTIRVIRHTRIPIGMEAAPWGDDREIRATINAVIDDGQTL